ncbi:response regulator [Aeromonas dhakensis]|uniref:response regulator n=1 Tax=Aeromonas dhakensis TaxID=196024 RepID=UPI0007EC3E5C|nr:response regulator [Aeromonas dhakensis]OBR45197.1 hypothetical protein A9196_02190 [Aeromonas dhakensis]
MILNFAKGRLSHPLVRWLPSIFVLFAGLTLSGLNSLQIKENNGQRVQEQLGALAQNLKEQILKSVTLYQFGLHGLRGAYITAGGVDNFNYQLLQKYTNSRDYSKEFPGARGIGFIQLVPQKNRDAFLSEAAQDRPDKTFELRQISPHQSDLFIIRYIEPENVNKQAIGLDIASEQHRRNAALAAAETGEATLTAPITLVQAENKVTQGFLYLLPLYKDGIKFLTKEDRLSNLQGWAYSPLLIDEVIGSFKINSNETVVTLKDHAEGQTTTFWEIGNSKDITSEFKPVSENISIAGRDWKLVVQPSRSFVKKMELPSILREFIGWSIVTCFVSLILFTLQLVISRRFALQKHREEIAEAEERSLKKANALLEDKVHTRTLQLAELGALNRSILMSSSYAIIATDLDGLITVFNPSAEQLLGYDAEELIGLQTPAIFHSLVEIEQKAQQLSLEKGEVIPVGFEVFVHKARQGLVDINKWTYIAKDGSQIAVSLSVTALRDDAGKLLGFLGVAQNLELQLKRERELETAREDALKASKAKSEFLANVSHEIRTPMNGILGLLKILLTERLTPRQKDFTEKAHQAGISLLVLLNDILDFSKIEAGKLDIEIRRFSLPALLEDVASLLAPQAEQKNVEFIFDVAPDMPEEIESDGNRMRQILINLVGNAIKFTEKGNVIVKVDLNPKNVSHAILQIQVVDHGIGMTEDQLKGLFQEFRQADSSISRRFGGTGLGLAIVHKLIDLMGGKISVTSVIGQGTQFSVDLPVVVPLPQNRAYRHFNGTSVLVVEDNPATALVLAEMLKHLGCDVSVANTAEDAVILLMEQQHNAAPIQVMIVDWLLPGADGITLLKKIYNDRALLSKPKAILTTSYRNKLTENQVINSQNFDLQVLSKPVSIKKLCTLLDKVFEAPIELDEESSRSLQTQNRDLTGIKILLVEDNPTNRIVATELLSQYGAQITEAFDGYEAISILKQNSFDLILMDMQMPGIDGLETTQRIRSNLKLTQIPIIAMTANATKENKDACKAAGMDDHIAKPFEIEPVVSLIRSFINKQIPVHVESVAHPEREVATLSTEVSDFCSAHGVSISVALSRLGGLKLYKKVLRQFILDVDAAVEDLSGQELKRTKARILYHSLKGGAANCGLKELSALLQEAESSSISGDTEWVKPHGGITDALREAQLVVKTLLSFFESDEASATSSTFNDSEFLPILQCFITSLKHSDMKALQQFEQLKHYLAHKNPSLALELETFMTKLAFKKCLLLLEQMNLVEV